MCLNIKHIIKYIPITIYLNSCHGSQHYNITSVQTDNGIVNIDDFNSTKLVKINNVDKKLRKISGNIQILNYKKEKARKKSELVAEIKLLNEMVNNYKAIYN
jgi:hypothetical protein